MQSFDRAIMKQFYEVVVQAQKVIVVEVDVSDGDDPLDEVVTEAVAEAFPFTFDVEVVETRLLSTESQIESAIRHADDVIKLNE